MDLFEQIRREYSNQPPFRNSPKQNNQFLFSTGGQIGVSKWPIQNIESTSLRTTGQPARPTRLINVSSPLPRRAPFLFGDFDDEVA